MQNEWIEFLVREKNYSLAVSASMPDSDFLFRPSPDVWTFSELTYHMSYSIAWMIDNYIHGDQTEWKPGVFPDSPAEVRSSLNASFELLEKTLGEWNNGKDSLEGLMKLFLHNAHHRGQATTYLRCKGILPPEYPF